MTETTQQQVAPPATTQNPTPVPSADVKTVPQERFNQVWAESKAAEEKAAKIEAEKQEAISARDARIAELEAENARASIQAKQADINAAFPEATKYLKEFPELGFSNVKTAEEYEASMKTLNERLLSKQTGAPKEEAPQEGTPAPEQENKDFLTPTPPANINTGDKKTDFKSMSLEDYRNIPEADRLEFGRSLENK